MKDVYKARRSIGIVAFAIAFIFLLSLSIQLVVTPLVGALAPRVMRYPIMHWVLGSLPLYAVAMPLSLLLFRQATPVTPPTRKRITAPAWISAFSVCLVGTYLLSFVGDAMSRLVSSMTGAPSVNPLASMTVSSPVWCNFIFLVILAPVLEEIFLRKLVIDRLLPYGELAAILLSGIAFGLVHGNLYQLFYACASGVLFGWIYVKTGNIFINISLHACLNFIGGVYSSEIEKLRLGDDYWSSLIADPAALASILSIVYAVLLACAGIVCIILIVRRKKWISNVRLEKPTTPLSKEDWSIALWRNPLVWFFLGVSLFMLLI